MDNISFICDDVNCSLTIRFKNSTIKYFNPEYQFGSLLNENLMVNLFYSCFNFVVAVVAVIAVVVDVADAFVKQYLLFV